MIYSEYNDIFIFTRVFIASPALSVTSTVIILNSAPVLIRAKYSIILLIVTGTVGAAVIKKTFNRNNRINSSFNISILTYIADIRSDISSDYYSDFLVILTSSEITFLHHTLQIDRIS